ncbi:hypothetical protein BpHYR1_014233 [Brachionus plicatilis]|uniref:Uncharacterized protein n=1 Tax=Brachionus plicatilis TaxID=10195 RepID=A0A3M7SBR7_BRAPC|nr:hypothetical protein BpHYR1_014233 [Brachionus plicatilis]
MYHLEVKIEIIKKHTEQKITTSKLAKFCFISPNFIPKIPIITQVINKFPDDPDLCINFSDFDLNKAAKITP